MSRDFRYRAEPRHRSAAAARRGFAAGFLAGVLGFGLVWWVLGTRECPEPTADTSAADSRPAGDAERPATAAPDPVFTYPQVLEKQEVVVPDATVAARTEPAPPPPPTPKDDRAASAAAPGGGSFVLQVAALRTAADAQALRARLAERDLPAQVEATKIGNDTFHRVRLGPYRDLGAAQDAQARLQRAGYAGLIVRLK